MASPVAPGRLELSALGTQRLERCAIPPRVRGVETDLAQTRAAAALRNDLVGWRKYYSRRVALIMQLAQSDRLARPANPAWHQLVPDCPVGTRIP